MSKLVLILGIAVTAAAIAVGLLVFFSTGQMQVLGVTPETAAILLVGGLILIGVGAMIAALDRGAEATIELRRWLAGHDLVPPPPARTDFSRAGPSLATASAAAGTMAAQEPNLRPPSADPVAESAVIVASAATTETIAALDRAKEDVSKALGEPPPEPEAEPEEAGDDSEEDQLYVVEERLIRGRPARVLSDGTVEAETDEGWMRFENREHLEEYLDAMSPERG
jgi:hypothetical protein